MARRVSPTGTVNVVPAGAYDAVDVQLTATVTPSGASAELTDVIVTLVTPDGTVLNGGSGFVGAAETAATSNPKPGTYEVFACACAGAVPQSYDGAMTLTARAKSPLVASGTPCAPTSDTPKVAFGLTRRAPRLT